MTSYVEEPRPIITTRKEAASLVNAENYDILSEIYNKYKDLGGKKFTMNTKKSSDPNNPQKISKSIKDYEEQIKIIQQIQNSTSKDDKDNRKNLKINQ